MGKPSSRRMLKGLFGLCLMASLVWAGGDSGERGQGLFGRMKRVEKQLGLSAEQEKKLEDNRRAHRAEAKKLYQVLRQKHEALWSELTKPDYDRARVTAIHNELKDVEADLADQRLKGLLEVRKILTDEQFKKFGTLTREEFKKGSGREHKNQREAVIDAPPPK